MSRHSRITPNFEYDEKIWVVSIINTKPKDITGGHSALIVEGLENNSLSIYDRTTFIGQYEISAAAEEESCVNTMGIITKIKCYENEENTRNYEELKFPGRSYYVSRDDAKKMIQSIKEDAKRVEKGMQNRSIELKNEEIKSPEHKLPLHLDGEGKPVTCMPYQKLDESHPWVKLFGDTEAGRNCTGWCISKMEVAGIDPDGLLPKPKDYSGQCLIL